MTEKAHAHIKVSQTDMFKRDNFRCEICDQKKPEEKLETFPVVINLDKKKISTEDLATICRKCRGKLEGFSFDENHSDTEIIETINNLFDLYDFPETTKSYTQISKASSYLIPEIRGKNSDYYDIYSENRRLINVKLKLGQEIRIALKSVIHHRMPARIETIFGDYMNIWDDWITETQKIIGIYDDILFLNENGQGLSISDDSDELTKILLAEKRKWGSINDELVDIIPNMYSLHTYPWDRCPICETSSNGWFINDVGACRKCDTIWEKKGLIRKQWSTVEE